MPHRLRLALALLPLLATTAPAAEVAVATTGAMHHTLLDLVPAFTAASGHTAKITNDTAGGVRARVERGEAFDLVITAMAGLDALTKAGKIVPGTVTPLARSSIGLAVRDGAPRPDIATVEAFKRTLLDAPRVAYTDPASGGTTGIFLDQLFTRLGIGEAIRAKAVLVQGGLSAARIITGEATHALQPVSELMAVKGVTVVGKIPDAIQGHTIYGAGISGLATQPDAARALLAHLHGEPAARMIAANGMERP